MPAKWGVDRPVNPKRKRKLAKKMTEQMRRFAELYDGHGAATAVKVGADPQWARQNASNWLTHPEVRAIIQGAQALAHENHVKTKAELQEFWSRTVDDEQEPMKERLAASALLAKSLGMFLDKVESTHKLELPSGLSLEELRTLAARPLLSERAAVDVEVEDEEEEDAEFSESGEPEPSPAPA